LVGKSNLLNTMTNQNFDFIVRSTIIRGEKPKKGLDAVEAPTPHQMNRITGHLADGTKVLVAQRPGKGGMDFNKLMGGKVYAVAADGISPVMEKDAAGKATKVQKVEDGVPLYSSSGFYLLSSRDYPALILDECFTLLRENGSQVILVSDAQLAATLRFNLASEFDLELLSDTVCEALGDSNNMVGRFDPEVNLKRRRGIERATEEAQDTGEAYQGATYKELTFSKKDGNPALVVYWSEPGKPVQSALILREQQVQDGTERWVTQYLSPAEAWAGFLASDTGRALLQSLEAGAPVSIGFIPSHIMRTSISFRNKVARVLESPPDKAQYGDAVYIKGALRNWCRGIISVIHSQHPQFPTTDYDAHHYVVAPRQAEVGMSKKPGGQGWFAPETVYVDLLAEMDAVSPSSP
jgi:hypothetical protein